MKTLALLLAFASFTPLAFSQSAKESLNQCLADSTNGKDRRELARWIVAGMAQHPAMADLTTVPPEKLDAVQKTTAEIYMRLLTKDCVKELKSVSRTESEGSVRQSFEFLGRLAMQELMANPKVNEAMSGLARYGDTKKVNEILSAP